MTFDLDQHRHRFAAWAASRAAASARRNCSFSVALGKLLLERSSVFEDCATFASNPNSENFDDWHSEKRVALVDLSSTQEFLGISGVMTHGVAAKLINVYMKALFLPSFNHSGELDTFCNAIHPPIDSILLTELRKKQVSDLTNVWREAEQIRWSNFGSDDYQTLIDAIRQSTDGKLWMIEKYWRGHQ